MLSPFTILAICALIASTLALPVGSGPVPNPASQDMPPGISLWTSSTCQGEPTSVNELMINKTYFVKTDGFALASYKISRDMKFGGSLEFSNTDRNNACAKKLEITSPEKSGHPWLKDKCYTLPKGQTAQCFAYLQPDTPPSPPKPKSTPPPHLLKRFEDSGVKLHTWEQLGCPGKPTESQELLVDENKAFKREIRAYKLSGPLTSNQLLDFSQTDGNGDVSNPCGKFVERTNPMRNPNADGSLNTLKKDYCYVFMGKVSAQCVHFHY